MHLHLHDLMQGMRRVLSAAVHYHCKNNSGYRELPLQQNNNYSNININTDGKEILHDISPSPRFLEKGCHDVKEGKRFHVTLIKMGAEPGLYFGNKLIITYCRHGGLADGRQVFEEMRERNVITWTAMISGYVQHNRGEEALHHFKQMQSEGVNPNHFTFSTVLSTCAQVEAGQQIHARVITHGLESDVVVGNALIDMYVKCGLMADARTMFDYKSESQRNVISWTSIVAGYAKCGNIEDARYMFDEMPERNVVSWNAMIAAYAHHGHGGEALSLYHQMRQSQSGIIPTCSTFATVLSVCARLTSLAQGKLIHGHIVKCCLVEEDVVLGSSLLDMYAKCGSIEDARQIFEAMPERNVVSWTSMIDGYGKHGQAKEALQLFEQMQHSGIRPNDVTFLSVLSSCSHAGLLGKGFRLFDCMYRHHNISPRSEHYASMVDLLARAGCLEEARDFINKMPMEVKQKPEVWGALIGACRHRGNVELAKLAAQHLFRLKPQNNGTYVALSNVYAAVGMHDDAAKIIKTMKDKGIRMEPGCSWIELRNKVHRFLVDDRFHPQTQKIYATWEKLEEEIKQVGYVPETNPLFHDMEEEHKTHIPPLHSEKLAIAFGFISTPPGSSILIFKNLRVCSDCHIATKFISKIVDRQIIVRDANRFHHFKNGLCSCGDYW